MAKVAIVMGSDSDMPIMKKAAEFLDQIFSLSGQKVRRTVE